MTDPAGSKLNSRMKQFVSTLLVNLANCFCGRRILWHILAILLTVILVKCGVDWEYYQATRGPVLHAWMIPAAPIGALVPIFLPLTLFLLGAALKNTKTINTGWAIAQAELLGLLISSACKALTGRAHPARHPGPDLSQVFHFGLLRGGVFWGWPSSHTTVAFALALTVWTLYPRPRWAGCLAIAYALYIGLGVSMTIHWFSDFVAGAIVGAVIGLVVGKNSLHRILPSDKL